MYEQFFGLREKPFNLTPSPRFLYLSEGHKEALALLKYGVMDRKGFILLTGEVGTGKTTMVRTLLDNLNHTVKYVLLSNPIMSPNDFINYLALTAFKKKIHFDSKAHFLLVFEPYLKKVLNSRENFNLIIDEAHKLSFELLEEIRLLSNMETGDDKLINIFLVGQPELNEKLSDPRCRPLLQRISIRHHIHPLNLEETGQYITTRLEVAGAKKGNQIFSKRAVEAIHDFSRGYPREINILADNALLLGYSRGTKKISPSMVEECYEDMKLNTSPSKVSIQETEGRRDPNEIGAKGAPVELATHSTGQAFHPSTMHSNYGAGATSGYADRELETEVRPVVTGFESVKTSHSSRFWKWAAVLFFFTSLLLLALSLSGEKVFSHLSASISSFYQGALETIIGKPVTATNGINQVAPKIPEMNRTGLPVTPSNEIADKRTNGAQSEPIPSGITPERKIETVEIQEIPIAKIDGNKIDKMGSTPSEQALRAITTIQDKKKEPSRIIIIARGDTLSGITRRIYGIINDDIIAMVKTANPDLRNINRIKPGQRIILPLLPQTTEERENTTFTVHIASYKVYEPALSMYRHLLENGYEAYILYKNDSENGKIFRVTVGYFKSQKVAKDYATTIVKQGISTYANPIEVEAQPEDR